jgi:hypothetical protein
MVCLPTVNMFLIILRTDSPILVMVLVRDMIPIYQPFIFITSYFNIALLTCLILWYLQYLSWITFSGTSRWIFSPSDRPSRRESPSRSQ